MVSSLCNMTGQHGYVQTAHNMYYLLEMDDSSDNATMITHTVAAATTGSTLGNTYQTTPLTVFLKNWWQWSTQLRQISNCCINTLPCWRNTWLRCHSKHSSQCKLANPSFRLCQFNTWPSPVLHHSQVTEVDKSRGITKVGAAGAMANAEPWQQLPRLRPHPIRWPHRCTR